MPLSIDTVLCDETLQRVTRLTDASRPQEVSHLSRSKENLAGTYRDNEAHRDSDREEVAS